MSSSIPMLLDYIEKVIAELNVGVRKKSLRKTRNEVEKLTVFSDCLKSELPVKFSETTFANFDRHLHFIKYYLGKRDFEWIRSNFDDIKEKDLPKIKSEILGHIEKRKVTEIRIPVTPKVPKKEIPPLSNKVFIVHGRDHEQMKELKTMVSEFGLDPVVLHEKPSGSRTIVEKLEKYSDVGYAFVILSPDDIGVSFQDLFEKTAKSSYEDEAFNAARRILEQSRGSIERFIEFNLKFMQEPEDASKFLQFLIPRARQNVVLEFGYFIGLLGRDRVCCLYKGDVELPSDMHGIVYVPFKESVNEARDKIIKELKAVGYEIKVKKQRKETAEKKIQEIREEAEKNS